MLWKKLPAALLNGKWKKSMSKMKKWTLKWRLHRKGSKKKEMPGEMSKDKKKNEWCRARSLSNKPHQRCLWQQKPSTRDTRHRSCFVQIYYFWITITSAWSEPAMSLNHPLKIWATAGFSLMMKTYHQSPKKKSGGEALKKRMLSEKGEEI